MNTTLEVFQTEPEWESYNLDFLDTFLIKEAWNATGPISYYDQVLE